MNKTLQEMLHRRAPHALVCALALGVSGGAALAAGTGASGQAYGTGVKAAPGSSAVNSGRTAVSALCTETLGATNRNNSSGTSLPPIGSTGSAKTSVSFQPVKDGSAAVAKSDVEGVSLLGGMITAKQVTAVSSSIAGSGGFSTSSRGTMLGGTAVLGVPVGGDVAPNTTMALPGIGKVILNEQTSDVTSTSASLAVNAIHVFVTDSNRLGVPAGTEITIAHAVSDTIAAIGVLGGAGYGSSLTGAGSLDNGRTAAIFLPCVGTTDGKVDRNSATGISIPGVFASGSAYTTAQGSVTATSASGEITASVNGMNLLNTMVTSTAAKADAHATLSGSTPAFSDSGSAFSGLAVSGHPEVGSNPPPNTKVKMSGLGTLWLHRVIEQKDSIEVRMVELIVDTPNSLGLPVGSDFRMAVAKVGTKQ
jgi:hypothetical protein